MERTVFRFADALGPSVQLATLPKTAAFFERDADFDKAEVKNAKLYWRRMVPEKRAANFARADLYAQHRVVMGVHFPSDVEAGRLAGTVIGARLLQQADWQADYQAARAELRAALQLPALPARTP